MNKLTREDIRKTIVEIPLPEFVLNLFDEKEDLRKYGFYDCFRPDYNLVEKYHSKRAKRDANWTDNVFLFETMDDQLEFLVMTRKLKGFLRVHIDKKKPLIRLRSADLGWNLCRNILTWYEEVQT